MSIDFGLFMMARLSLDIIWLDLYSLLWVFNLSLGRPQLFVLCFGLLIGFLGLSLALMVCLKEILVLLLVEEFSDIIMVDFLMVSIKVLVITIFFFVKLLVVIMV